MNLLFRRYSLIRSQLIKNDYTFQLILFKQISRQFDGKQTLINKRCFSHTMSVIMLSQIAPLAGILGGRLIQRRWPQLRYTNISVIFNLIIKNKFKVLSAAGLTGAAFTAAVDRMREETPITKRQRIVVFNKEEVEPISEILFKFIYKANKRRILDVDHRNTKRVNRIVRRLLESNANFEEIAKKSWKVYVIKAPNTANAFVLPTGHIFVYTGIINCCNNDDQLAAILAHELSHTLLIHGKEVLSQEFCIDLIHSLAVILCWIRWNPIKALIGTVVSGLVLKSLFVLPKRRLIELEADFVGLVLAAKACYDVREGSAFWMQMSFLEDNKVFESLSTHPTNDFRFKLMDSYMDSMVKLMKCSDCPRLPETDPRDALKNKLSHSKRNVFRRD